MDIITTDAAQAAPAVTPLYGHTSPETAYVVDDYPYGYRLRCSIRYWLEFSPRHGWRFCSQTSNPKRPGLVWNAPKRSTYVYVSACMYLNADGHVKWTGLGVYSSADAVAAFVATFPDAPMHNVRALAVANVNHQRRRVAGSSGLAMNGVPVPMSEDDIAEARVKLGAWTSVAKDIVGRHLTEDHGWSNVTGMTIDDMVAAHKLAHEAVREADTF